MTSGSLSKPAPSLEFPGGKYPALFFFYLIPGLNHTAIENEKELDSIIANLQKEKVDPDALCARQAPHAGGPDPSARRQCRSRPVARELLRELR